MSGTSLRPYARRTLFAGASVFALISSQAAMAAQDTVETIVVTAQKRSENLQTVPISVSAVTGATMAKTNVVNLEQLANSMPNVQINHFSNSSGSAVFSIRGIGVNDADPYVGTTVSVVRDGVVMGVNTDAFISMFDIDRVEVLRGPQGTLFGANTTGGVVNVITKQPTGEFGGEAEVDYGNYNELDINAAVNFPITEKLAGKISVLHAANDGFFKDVLTHQRLGRKDQTAIRTYLKYADGNYDATLIAEYDRGRNGSQTSLNYSTPGMAGYSALYSTQSARPPFIRSQGGIPDQDYTNGGSITLTQNWAHSPIGDLVSISNYSVSYRDLYSNDGGIPSIFIQTHRTLSHDQASQELRDTFNIGERVQVIVGAFGFYQHYFLNQKGRLDGFLAGLGQPQTQNQTNFSISPFGQVYVDVTDKLRIQAGIRFSHERTSATSTSAQTLTLFGTTPGAPSSFNQPSATDPVIAEVLDPITHKPPHGNKSWDNIGAKVGADYKWTEDFMTYAFYARGFKSGGFTGRIAVPEDIGPYNPEYVDTFEGGLKSELFDHRMRVNFSGFWNIYNNMQVTQNITYPSGANSATITNAGGSVTRGFELETTTELMDGLELNLNAAYLDAHYTSYMTSHLGAGGVPVPIDYSGNPLMNAPKWNGSASLNYTVPVGPGTTDFFLQYNYTSSKYTNFDDLPQEKVNSINVLNGNITWTPDGGKWSVGVYGTNLTDVRYFGQRLYLPGTFAIESLAPPQQYGVQFKVHW